MDDRPKFRRQTSDVRRRMLIDATLRCLSTVGVEQLSVRMIAAEAGVSLGLINHHYASKDALIADAYQTAATDLLDGLTAAVDRADPEPRSRIAAFLRNSFSPRVLDPKLLKIWTAFWTLADRSPDVRAAHDRTYGEYRALLERLLAGLSRHGDESAFDVRLAAIGLSALLDGLWLEWCLNPETFSPREGVRICEAWLDVLATGALQQDREGGPSVPG